MLTCMTRHRIILSGSIFLLVLLTACQDASITDNSLGINNMNSVDVTDKVKRTKQGKIEK